MTSASELFSTRRSRPGRSDPDLESDSSLYRHHSHHQHHSLRRLRRFCHNLGLPERRPVRDVQGTPQYVNTNGTDLERESNSFGNLNGSERLPGSVLLARARLVQRLRGVSLSGNRSVQMESSFHTTDRVQVSYECNKKPHGLTQGAIDGLHRLTFSSAEVITERRDCSICLESFVNGDMLISLPCTHSFHSSCLNPWLKACGDCPCCRRAIG